MAPHQFVRSLQENGRTPVMLGGVVVDPRIHLIDAVGIRREMT